jgi:hypothetical protein
MPIYIGKRPAQHYGEPDVPYDIERRRQSVFDMMQRMGTPIVHKHRYNDLDRQAGFAAKTTDVAGDIASDIYDQPRNYEQLSYGVGFVGALDGEIIYSEDEFFDPNWDGFNPGTSVLDDTFIWRVGVDGDEPPEGYIPAPKYRGYGPGSLIYIIMPDRAEDYFKANVGGPLFKVQEAYAIAPWYPEINDNDLIIPVEVGPDGQIIGLTEYGKLPNNQKYDRFEAKMASPVSIRGHDRMGARERNYTDTWGNRFVVNQTFEMALLPLSDIAYEVEVDR